MAKTKITTIDDLARIINEGFKTTATKEDVKTSEDRLTARLDRIEHLLLAKPHPRAAIPWQLSLALSRSI